MSHVCLFEWKISSKWFLWNHKNGTFHMELKWYNQLIFNIWLNISSSFAIIWIILRIYLHFVIYWYMYQFFTNAFFNQLKSIKNYSFFWQLHYLTIELFYCEYNLWINFFFWLGGSWKSHNFEKKIVINILTIAMCMLYCMHMLLFFHCISNISEHKNSKLPHISKLKYKFQFPPSFSSPSLVYKF
jgi:hypothetical protein